MSKETHEGGGVTVGAWSPDFDPSGRTPMPSSGYDFMTAEMVEAQNRAMNEAMGVESPEEQERSRLAAKKRAEDAAEAVKDAALKNDLADVFGAPDAKDETEAAMPEPESLPSAEEVEEPAVEFKCEECDKVCKSLAGLKAHARGHKKKG